MGRPPTIQLMQIRGPTIQTYEGPQGPGTMFLKSGTVPEIQNIEEQLPQVNASKVGLTFEPAPTIRVHLTSLNVFTVSVLPDSVVDVSVAESGRTDTVRA